MSEHPETPEESPFSSPNPEENPFEQGGPFEQPESSQFESAPWGGNQLSVGWKMARMWVKENQRAAMLGAFATGVFMGAYLRD